MEEAHNRLGLCQWFHFHDRTSLDLTIDLLRDVGVRHLRTGVSWADFHRHGGCDWYDTQMTTLAEAGLDILLSVWHTPPSLAEAPHCNAPPRRLRDYADFIDLVITRYGHAFSTLELWNEPNNRFKWDFQNHDPDWSKFATMVIDAAHWAKRRGITTCLGGIIPADPHWIDLMARRGVLDHIDIIALHAFPHMWWPDAPCWDWHTHWHGWQSKINTIRRCAPGKPLWVTETGLATCDLTRRKPARHNLQVQMLREAATAPAERIYWYSLIDLDPKRDAIEGFHIDENEYHMGLVTFDGHKKPAYHVLKTMMHHIPALSLAAPT
jgi:CDP-paratose 2-epimerase